MKTETINRFDKGMAEDNRISDTRFCSVVKHFDTTYPKRLIPYPQTEPDNTKAMDIVKFIYAPGFTSTTFKLWGYGKASASTAAGVFRYDLDAGDPDSTSWVTPANNEGSTTGRDERVFFHYKNYLYNWAGGTKLQRFGDLTNSATFTDAYKSITYTDVAQPVHHKADDIAYFFHDNIVATLNNTTFVDDVLTLPDNMIITSATEFGNYLAIGCSPKTSASSTYSFSENSVVYLWNRDSSLTTISEKIDLGRGRLVHLAELDGQLIAVMDYYVNNLYGLVDSKIIIKRIVGNNAYTLNNIAVDSSSSSLFESNWANSFVSGERLYFPAKIINDGDTNKGIYSVDSNGKITIEVVEEDVASSNEFQGIYRTGGMWWIAHSNDGSINRTDDNKVYSYTSVYETLKISDDLSKKQQLLAVSVTTEALPSVGQVVLKYRKDEETAWTTILTSNTDDKIVHSSPLISGTGDPLITFNELQLRIESTGGAVITGLKYSYEEVEGDNID